MLTLGRACKPTLPSLTRICETKITHKAHFQKGEGEDFPILALPRNLSKVYYKSI